MIQKLKGTKDILPSEIGKWQYIEKVSNELFSKYGFKEIRFPVIEASELFLRGVGETTDIVQKEMYIFEDKGGRSIALRPEGTAGVIRAYLENGMASMPSPIKLNYAITTYRYENVQKGRQREFHQIGAELIGSDSPMADVEIIEMCDQLLKKLNIKNIELNINSIGCKECRAKYQEALRDFIRPNLDKYCDTCKTRFEKNPMRILDCKVEADKAMNEGAPQITDYLCDDCKDHFAKVQNGLNDLGIEFKIDPGIVRGLDYYSKTVFEFISKEDGLTTFGGGRYDGLVEELGGAPTPAIGFAIGQERLLSVFESNNPEMTFDTNMDVFIATIGDSANSYATKLIRTVREKGIYAEKDIMERSLKAQFKYADKKQAKYVVTIGDTEVETGKATLKEMATGAEREIELANLAEEVK